MKDGVAPSATRRRTASAADTGTSGRRAWRKAAKSMRSGRILVQVWGLASRAVASGGDFCNRYGMSEFGVDVSRDAGGVAWVVLRNPARLNAVRLEMWE